MRNYYYSKKNKVIMDFFQRHNAEVTVKFKGIGTIILRGETFKEFLSIIRANTTDDLLGDWLAKKKDELKLYERD